MPGNILQEDHRDDEDTSNLLGLDHGPGSPFARDGKSHPKAPSVMMWSRESMPIPHRDDFGVHAGFQDGSDASAPQAGRSNPRQDVLLQPPEGGDDPSPRGPLETSIWDWDTPSASAGEPSASYYFEPQGELLHEHHEQHHLRSEFTIPHPVTGSAVTWPFQTANGASDGEGFTVPPRPTGSVATTAGIKRKSQSDQTSSNSKQVDRRSSPMMSESGDEPMSPLESTPQAHHKTRSQSGPSNRGKEGADIGRRSQPFDAEPLRPVLTMTGRPNAGPRRTQTDPSVPTVLQARKVFPIQIGDKLFRLSGASISSDAPSYFSQFFEDQLRQSEGADSVRTLYVDRDPATFEDIALHLQGYHVEPRDCTHFVKLFADAQYYSLPRLTQQLFASTIYIRIGEREFQIPRDLFNNPGDSPNYFSLGFSIFFTTPSDVFPGLSERSLLRPPSILPPSIPHKSAKTFADLLRVLKGYPVQVRSEEHRQELLRDARYFHLKGLEQRLLPHQISFNLARNRTEIVMRLEDVRQSGISFVGDNAAGASSAAPSPMNTTPSVSPSGPGWIYYQRPFVDTEAYSLILEMAGEENTFLSLEPTSTAPGARVGRARFFKETLTRITRLFSVIASKMNLPVTQPLGQMMLERGAGIASLPVSPGNTGMSEEKVKVRIGADADVTVDGKRWSGNAAADDDDESSVEAGTPRSSTRAGSKRPRQGQGQGGMWEDDDDGEEWIVRRAQWRVRVQPVSGGGGAQSGNSGMEVILGAVKMEAFSNERARNVGRGFLT